VFLTLEDHRARIKGSLCAAVRRIFVRAVLAAYRERAEREGISGGRGGAVVFVQRFGSALNLNSRARYLA